ncbi:MAG TPA: hypothetical protein VHW74_10365 [Mycobacteriales bacterium]|jgi:hypothetical protein|nr:hypothetical protein [Mycobacteriales bacterium]
MTNQPLDEPAHEVDAHPPFRMRSRSRLLLPDIAPPTRAELRWAAERRRIQRAERDAARQAVREAKQLASARVAEVVEAPVEAPPVAVDEPVTQLVAAPDEDWLIFPEVAGSVAPVDPDPDPQPEPEPEWEPDPEPEAEPEPEPEAEADPEPEALAAFKPLALDPVDDVKPATFARLRSPRVAVRRPDWLDRGPLFDDADDIELPELEPSLDLDFHPDTSESPAWASPERAGAELAPWRPSESDDVDNDDWLDEEDEPPVVSQLLVVRDPRGAGPSRIAVLDDASTTGLTDTVALPRQPFVAPDDHLPELDDYFVDHQERDVDLDLDVDGEPGSDWPDLDLPVRVARESIHPTLAPDIEERYEYEPAPDVPKVWDGRPAPMFWRVLRLRHIRPNGWLRALFFEGSVALAVVLVLAGAASVWTIVVLPMVVALIVKANDVLVGSLRRSFAAPEAVAYEREEELV